MINLGNDILKGTTVRIPFSTTDADGDAITIGTNGTPYAIVDGSTTEVTTGVSLSEDFDSVTGSHFIAVDTSQSGFTLGSEVVVGLKSAAVDGKTINVFLGRFGIQMANSAKPVVGLAQGGSTNYVDLPTSAPSTNGFLTNCTVVIKHIATGFREARQQASLTAYVGSSRRFYVSPDFDEAAATGDEVEVFLGSPAVTDSTPNVNVASADTDVITDDAISAAAVIKINAAIDAIVTAIKAKTDLIPASPAAVSDIPTATANRNALLNWEPYTGFSFAKIFRAIGIVLFGTKTGSGTDTEIFTAPAGGATVTATVDVDANRSAVITDASGTP